MNQKSQFENIEKDSSNPFENDENILNEEFKIIKETIENIKKKQNIKKFAKEQEIMNLKEKRQKINSQKLILMETVQKKQEMEKKANEILIHEVY